MMAIMERIQVFLKTLTVGDPLGRTDLLMWSVILLGSMFACCLAVFFLTMYVFRRQRHSDLPILPRNRKSLWKTPLPIPTHVFGQPRRWMAFRTRNLGLVRNALGVTNAEVCSWEQGLCKATERNLFIAPPIRGWVLVFGHFLPNPSDDVDAFYGFMRNVSSVVGEVQFFCMDVVMREHAWVRLIDGNVVRSYAWSESTLWNEGRSSSAEISLQMHAFDYGFQASEIPEHELHEKLDHNTNQVHALAARWSLDPLRVEPKDFASEFGLTGEMDRLQVG